MPWVYNVFTDTLVHSKDPEDYVAKNTASGTEECYPIVKTADCTSS